jgi:hypothetical protein
LNIQTIKRSKYKYIKTRTLSQADGQGKKKQQIPCLPYEEGIFIYGAKSRAYGM